MSTRPRVLTAAALAVTVALGGCGGSDPSSAPAPGGAPSTLDLPSGGASPTGPDVTVPPLPQVSSDLVGDLQRVLDARAGALLSDDREAFLAGLAPDDDLLTTEGGYFDNISQLPVSVFSYRLEPASLVRSGDAYWGVVEVEMQLSPYDAEPVRTGDRFRFVPSPAGAGEFLISSTTDRRWEAANITVLQPWDTEPIRVREGSGVLGVFDSADKREANGIVTSVERGILDVAARVPYSEWGSRAVVYALSDPRFLESFEDLPGGDPQALDGVAFTVPAGTDDTTIASTRFAISPDLLPVASARRVDPDLDRLVRHELVHVAVGDHDDASPLWLSEGVAEWVSVQALPPADRDVPDSVLTAARRGITTMPTDDSFNDDDSSVHYALAWWVCEYLAQTYGPDAPWQVMDAFTLRAGDDERAVVKDLLQGVTVDQLARRGAQLMLSTYEPVATQTPSPTSPTSPTPSSPTTPDDDYTVYDPD